MTADALSAIIAAVIAASVTTLGIVMQRRQAAERAKQESMTAAVAARVDTTEQVLDAWAEMAKFQNEQITSLLRRLDGAEVTIKATEAKLFECEHERSILLLRLERLER